MTEKQGPKWAVDACPLCGAAMPEPTEEERRLCGDWEAGAWDEAVEGMGTGCLFGEDCPGCGIHLSGWEFHCRNNLSVPFLRIKWYA